MVSRRRIELIYGQGLLMVAVVVLAALFGFLSYDVFFVGSLAAFLLVSEATKPSAVRQPWRGRLDVALVVGLAVFLVYAGVRVYAILPDAVVP